MKRASVVVTLSRCALGALTLLLASACGPHIWSAEGFKRTDEHGGINQASFDMKCPIDRLRIIDLKSAVGVEGCGKSATYKWVYGAGWVANTADFAQN